MTGRFTMRQVRDHEESRRLSMRSIRHTPTKFHPRTGLPLVPIGRRKDGRLIWPIMGAAEGDGDDAGAGDAGAGDTGDKGGDDAGDKGGDAGKTGDADKGEADKGDKQDDSKKGDDDASPWDDPTKAKAEIEKLRRENGSARNQAKADAAKEAREELVKEFGKTLGFIKDGDDKIDPEQALKEARTAQRESAAELVVWREAADLKVDAQAVTDSRAFAAAIKELDPASDTFAADVKKAAQEAAEKNPKLKSGQASGSSSADHAGGSGGGTKKTQSLPLDQAYAQHYGS